MHNLSPAATTLEQCTWNLQVTVLSTDVTVGSVIATWLLDPDSKGKTVFLTIVVAIYRCT